MTRGFGLLQGLAPVIWFSSFTVMVAVAKWIVIGVQSQGRVPLSTHAYLAYWYTNAMLNVWETIGGRWLLGTKLITFFYRTMGAKARSQAREQPKAPSAIYAVIAWVLGVVLLLHIWCVSPQSRVVPVIFLPLLRFDTPACRVGPLSLLGGLDGQHQGPPARL